MLLYLGLDFLFIWPYLIVSSLLSLYFKGRDDDNIETIRKRFKVYMESSLPVIEYYSSKGKVRKVILLHLFTPRLQNALVHQLTCPFPSQIDASKPVEEVFEAVKEVFTSMDDKVKQHRHALRRCYNPLECVRRKKSRNGTTKCSWMRCILPS